MGDKGGGLKQYQASLLLNVVLVSVTIAVEHGNCVGDSRDGWFFVVRMLVFLSACFSDSFKAKVIERYDILSSRALICLAKAPTYLSNRFYNECT